MIHIIRFVNIPTDYICAAAVHHHDTAVRTSTWVRRTSRTGQLRRVHPVVTLQPGALLYTEEASTVLLYNAVLYLYGGGNSSNRDTHLAFRDIGLCTSQESHDTAHDRYQLKGAVPLAQDSAPKIVSRQRTRTLPHSRIYRGHGTYIPEHTRHIMLSYCIQLRFFASTEPRELGLGS